MRMKLSVHMKEKLREFEREMKENATSYVCHSTASWKHSDLNWCYITELFELCFNSEK